MPDNPDIRAKMRAIAEQRRRFGYRWIGLMLEREGIMMNHKKLRRIYGEEGLSVKRRRGRKRALGTRAPMLELSGPSIRWSLDFVSDSFGDGRRFRILAVIDDFTRECLALVADTSLSGARVARELDRIIRLYGKPQMIVSDNGQPPPSCRSRDLYQYVIAFLRDIDRDEHSFLCDRMYLGHGQAAPLWWWLE